MLTKVLFDLVSQTFEPSDQAQSKNNLDLISMLLKHSRDYKAAKSLASLEINVAKSLASLGINFDTSYRITKKFSCQTTSNSTAETYNSPAEIQPENETLLTAAIEAGRLEVVQLLTPEMKINDYSIATTPPLFCAVRKNLVEITNFLLANGAEINKQLPGKIDATALHVAARYNAYEAAKTLVLNHADLTLKDNQEKTALYYNNRVTLLIQAAQDIKNAIEELENKGNVFSATALISSALNHDASFVISYMGKMAEAATLRGQHANHDQLYYHPHLLKIALGQIETFIRTIPEFTKNHFPKGYFEILEHLNGYDCNSPQFEPQERIFRTPAEKNEILKWFEVGTAFEKVKSHFKEGENNKLGRDSPIVVSHKKTQRNNSSKPSPEVNNNQAPKPN